MINKKQNNGFFKNKLLLFQFTLGEISDVAVLLTEQHHLLVENQLNTL